MCTNKCKLKLKRMCQAYNLIKITKWNVDNDNDIDTFLISLKLSLSLSLKLTLKLKHSMVHTVDTYYKYQH